MGTTENPNPWTGPKIEQLTGLWRDGLSASQIASKLDGVTRNAVLGKIHRLGLAARQTKARSPSKPRTYSYNPKPRNPRIRSFESEFPAIPFQEPVMDISPVTPHIDFVALETHHCRFPYGDPRASDFHYCGHSRSGGLPYCEGHARIAYQSTAPRMRSGELERELAKAG